MQNEIFEKMIEKLESKAHNYYPTIDNYCVSEKATKLTDAKEIVRQVAAEYNNGWIPVENRTPDSDNYILLSFANCTIKSMGMGNRISKI